MRPLGGMVCSPRKVCRAGRQSPVCEKSVRKVAGRLIVVHCNTWRAILDRSSGAPLSITATGGRRHACNFGIGRRRTCHRLGDRLRDARCLLADLADTCGHFVGGGRHGSQIAGGGCGPIGGTRRAGTRLLGCGRHLRRTVEHGLRRACQVGHGAGSRGAEFLGVVVRASGLTFNQE
jgi:hypothetical protein